MSINRTIQRSDMGAGNRALVTDDGVTHASPANGAPKDLLKSGQKVKVHGRVRRCHDVCHEIGPILKSNHLR